MLSKVERALPSSPVSMCLILPVRLTLVTRIFLRSSTSTTKRKVIMQQAVLSPGKTPRQRTNNPLCQWLELFATLEYIPCIRSPVRVWKLWDKIRTVSMTSTATIAMKALRVTTFVMAMMASTKFSLQNKIAKVWLFWKPFYWLKLAWFVILSCADIRFTKSLSRQLTQLS